MFRRLATVVAVSLVSGLLLGSPAASQGPAATDWMPIITKQACAVHQGPVLIGTPDGKHFSMFVSGMKVGDQPMRAVKIDEKPYVLTFTQANQMGMADLDAATLGALVASSRVTLDWPEGKAELSTAGLLGALNSATACGAGLEQKRLVEAQRRERARRASQDLDEFMANMPGPPPIPGMTQGTGIATHPTALQGVTCFKTGERISGINKICAYDCMGSQSVQTIGNAELCPATMRSPR